MSEWNRTTRSEQQLDNEPGDDQRSRPQQIAKRMGILNAVHIPDDDIRAHFPQPLLPVNTFRFLFKDYFSAPIEPLPDRVFYWQQAAAAGAPVVGTALVEVGNGSTNN